MTRSKMHEEIREQPEVLRRILEDGWNEVKSAGHTLRDRGLRSAMISARGTSDNAACYAKYLFEVLLGIPVSLAAPSVFTLYESRVDLGETLVIGISQSGESRDILETVRQSKAFGATTLTITNNEDSSMAGAADKHLFLRAGEEESVAATKTYTAQLLVLYLLVAALNGEETLGEEVMSLPEEAARVLESEWEGVERYRYADHLVVTSRGYNLATAQEAALKLMETTYVVSQPFSAADLEHGPMAMIGKDFPVVAIVPPGKVRPRLGELLDSLNEKGAEVAVIADDGNLTQAAPASFLVPVSCSEELSPILYAIPPQVLAHDLSISKGLDPDSPRGLTKVTETW
ncbi:MAG: SIS domain-containing protein [Rubrobacteraceae bacterium]